MDSFISNLVAGGAARESVQVPKVYSATATAAAGAKANATQQWADLILEGGDGIGVTVPDPGANGALAVVRFTASALCSLVAAAGFRVFVDGYYVGGCSPITGTTGEPIVAAVNAAVPIAGGAPHSIKVKFRANAGTITIDPTSDGSANAPYHATLTVELHPLQAALPSPAPVGQAALDLQRTALTRWIWKGPLPTTGASAVDRNWAGDPKPTGCNRIDRYTFLDLAGRGGKAFAWLMYPTAAPLGKLMISHNGHKESYDGDNLGDAARTLENTQFWLSLGFHVLSLDMPCTQAPGRQPNPLTLNVAGVDTQFTSHAFAALETDGRATSLAPFVEPVVRGLTQALSDLPGYPVYAIGLSGGGFTVEFAAAVDTRIRNRYSVFGSLPWEIVPVSNLDPTDYEQYYLNPVNIRGGLHAIRYALGADHGRRAISVWSDGDPTFGVTGKHTELDNFKAYVLTLLGAAGVYDWHQDTSAAAHQYTDQTLSWIWSDIQAHP